MNIICKLFGHRVSRVFFPDGYCMCDRCGASDHPAYDYGDRFWKSSGILRIDKKIKRLVARYRYNAELRRNINSDELPF